MLNLLSKALHILSAIAVTVHPIVAKLNEVVIAKLFSLCCSVLYKLVIDIVKLFFVVGKEVCIFFPCLYTNLPIAVVEIWSHK